MVRKSNVFSHIVIFMALFSFMLFIPKSASCEEKWDYNHKKAESGKVEAGGTWNAPFEKEIKGKFQTVVLGNAEITGNNGGTAKASYNKGIFGEGSIAQGIAGGFASVGKNQDTNIDEEYCNSHPLISAEANYNSIIMQSGSILASASDREYESSYLSSTSMYIFDAAPPVIGYIYGGFAKLENSENKYNSAKAKNNSIYIQNAHSSEKGLFPIEHPDWWPDNNPPYGYFIIGGNAEIRWKQGTAIADKNKVIVNAAVNNYQNLGIVGGYAWATRGYSSASDNYVEIDNAGECSEIYGGFVGISKYVTAVSGNTVYIKDGIIKNDVAGGKIDFMEHEGGPTQTKCIIMASGNTTWIAGGKYENEIYGVSAYIWADMAIIENNKVILSHGRSMPEFSDKTLIRGYKIYKIESVSKFSNNSLEFRDVKGLTAGNIENFDKIIFELPDMQAGETVLSLCGYDPSSYDKKTNIMNTSVDVQKIGKLTNIDGGEFRVGDKVCLLRNTNGIKTDGCILNTVPCEQGFTLELRSDDTSIYLTRIK